MIGLLHIISSKSRHVDHSGRKMSTEALSLIHKIDLRTITTLFVSDSKLRYLMAS